jgi:hypothetical protein
MKVALCLQGLVGSVKGKHCHNAEGSDIVIDISSKHNKEHVIDVNDQVDVFLHSWNVNKKDKLVETYNPKDHLFQEQIIFDVPPDIAGKPARKQAHYSRWYSFQKVLELVKNSDVEYDWVLVQRFDLCWNINLDFSKFNKDILYVGDCYVKADLGLSDRWFFGSPENMFKMGEMYDKIPEYMRNDLVGVEQYGGISSHILCHHHIKKNNIPYELIFNYGEVDRKPNDYSEVRRQYYGDRS